MSKGDVRLLSACLLVMGAWALLGMPWLALGGVLALAYMGAITARSVRRRG